MRTVRRRRALLAALLAAPSLARAAPATAPVPVMREGEACAAGVAAAYRRAEALPPSNGRAALLEQVQRADVAHHEDDDAECREQLGIATGVLDRIDASRRAGR